MQKRLSLEHSKCACKCDKHCNIDEYLKSCTCIKGIIDDLVMICNEIVNMLETINISTIAVIHYFS